MLICVLNIHYVSLLQSQYFFFLDYLIKKFIVYWGEATGGVAKRHIGNVLYEIALGAFQDWDNLNYSVHWWFACCFVYPKTWCGVTLRWCQMFGSFEITWATAVEIFGNEHWVCIARSLADFSLTLWLVNISRPESFLFQFIKVLTHLEYHGAKWQ